MAARPSCCRPISPTRPGRRRFYERLDPELQRRFGSNRFDILVNNAGAGTRAVIEDVSERDLDETLQVDLKAPFFLIKYASSRLRDGGRIVNVSSMGTRVAYPEMAAYSPAKAGLEALTLLLAAHFGPRGITVNAVLPGATATDMNPGARIRYAASNWPRRSRCAASASPKTSPTSSPSWSAMRDAG